MSGTNVSLQVQLLGALKWLLHFNVFDHISELSEQRWARREISYDDLATKANLPVDDLTRMLRTAMTNHIFAEVDEESFCHSPFSLKLAKDENFIHGLPFFCDTVIPAMGKMVDRTTYWQANEQQSLYTTARGLACNDELEFDEFLTQKGQATRYTRMMNLLSCGRSPPSSYMDHVVRGAVQWSSLKKGALIVDFDSDGACSLEMAELFPHLRFHVHVAEEKVDDIKAVADRKDPSILERIEFRPQEENIASKADVYLLTGLNHHRQNRDMARVLNGIAHFFMDLDKSEIIVIESLRPDPECSTLAMERMLQCRDVTMWQLQDSGGDRTLHEFETLVREAREGLYIKHYHRRPNSTVATLVISFHD